MQIQILKPAKNGKHYPDYDQMIANSHDEDERNYLIETKEMHEKWKAKGFDDGFAFGIVYTRKMACGHYELFQHPIYRQHNAEPTEDDILESLQSLIEEIRETKKDRMKCTRCICGFQ